jgi:phage recombination protein Bet
MEEDRMSTNLVAVQKDTRLTMPAPEYSTEQIKLLAETVAKGCDQNELAFFLQVAKLKRLDPFTGQIHVVKRWDSSLGKEKISIQTGVDGYRAIASRTGDLAGIDDPEYDSEVEEHPNWAKITVYRYGRGDEKVPYRATARWGEYVQTYKDKQTGELKPNPMWKRMPYLMLGKVAESLALRKAFPDELSGMYTNEEMGQADNETPGITPASLQKPPVSMPKSTDERKVENKPAAQQGKAEAAPQGQQTASQGQQEAALEKLSGEISTVTPGKNGVVVLAVSGNGVIVPARLATDDLIVGAKILCSVAKVTIKGNKMLEVREIEMVMLPVQEGEIIDAEVSEPEPAKGPDPFLDEARAAGVGGIFDDAPPPKTQAAPATQEAAGEATKPGTIGVKRARRLYAIISQNYRNTGFSEKELKKVMSALPVSIEHLRDLELGLYEEFEKFATGEKDFHDFWKD